MGDMAGWSIDNGVMPWDGLGPDPEEREEIEKMEKGMANTLMILGQLGSIRRRLIDLHRVSKYRETIAFTPPHPNPDFNSLQDFLFNWNPLSDRRREQAEDIARDLRGLRDLVKLSDLAVDFRPLEGHGYRYDASTGKITCHRNKYARQLIDKVGAEVDAIIKEVEGLVE